MVSSRVYATLLTKNEYLAGVLVLNHGLRLVNSKYPLMVMAPPKLSQEARDILHLEGIVIRDVEPLRASNVHFDELDKRFEDTWTKIRVWELLDFERVVLLDSDMIVRRNMDELLDDLELQPGQVAAAHVCACNPRNIPHYPKDWIPKNCAHSAVQSPTSPPPQPTESSPRPYTQLNSGLVVLQPSKETFEKLRHRLSTDPAAPTFLFADQDLITAVFQGMWRPLPWYYNALRTLRNVHPAVWSDDEVRCLHYIFADKPWRSRRTTEDKAFAVVNQWWWDHYDAMISNLRAKDAAAAELVASYVDYDSLWQP